MTPAEQIRAALEYADRRAFGDEGRALVADAFAALDALEAERDTVQARLDFERKNRREESRKAWRDHAAVCKEAAELEERLDALEGKLRAETLAKNVRREEHAVRKLADDKGHRREGICEVYDWTGAYRGCIGVETWEQLKDADRVWLTRDEAGLVRNVVRSGMAGEWANKKALALLDERIGDTKPTSIRAMIDGENPPLKKGAS